MSFPAKLKAYASQILVPIFSKQLSAQEYTWATKPSAVGWPRNLPILITDIGVNGALFYSTGTRWVPVSNYLTLAKRTDVQSPTPSTSSYVIYGAKAQIPAGFLEVGDFVRMHLQFRKSSGTAQQWNPGLLIGPNGSFSDTAVVYTGGTGATNVSGSLSLGAVKVSATSWRGDKTGQLNSSLFLDNGFTTSQNDLTVSSVPNTDTTAQYLTVYLNVAAGASGDQFDLLHSRIDVIKGAGS